MPSLNIQALITLLEEIDMNLGLIWSDCQNYDLLPPLEEQRRKLMNIIQTLENLEKKK